MEPIEGIFYHLGEKELEHLVNITGDGTRQKSEDYRCVLNSTTSTFWHSPQNSATANWIEFDFGNNFISIYGYGMRLHGDHLIQEWKLIGFENGTYSTVIGENPMGFSTRAHTTFTFLCKKGRYNKLRFNFGRDNKGCYHAIINAIEIFGIFGNGSIHCKSTPIIIKSIYQNLSLLIILLSNHFSSPRKTKN